jgi:glc operon protein GlcG
MISTLSLNDAQSLIDYAINWATTNEKTIAVAVVDTAGELIAFNRMDASSPQTCLLAQNKAYTAARDRQKTSDLAKWALSTNKTISFWTDARITGMAGGVPIADAKSRVIGGLGISGMDEFEDEKLALRSIEDVLSSRREN